MRVLHTSDLLLELAAATMASELDEHATGARGTERDGVRYVNGACHLRIHELR